MVALTLTKHHGLGNDFLVVLAAPGPTTPGDPEPTVGWPDLARRLCHRRLGIGADGLLIGTDLDGPVPDGRRPADVAAGPTLGMALYNADGSIAEMSGNGIRCLVQAWARRHHQDRGEVLVATVAGPRCVSFWPGPEAGTMLASVDMGPVHPIAPPAGWPDIGVHHDRPVAHLSLGNPHTVVAVDDIGAVDLATIGLQVPDVNLEILTPGPERAAITMRVHERGAGITQACGTGACAAAWAASDWGLVEADEGEITVHMDGGDARVRLQEPAPGRVTLIGPATFAGTVEVER